MGHSFHPNSRAIWGIYHPIYLLLSTGHFPSHTFSMGHPFFPFLAAFHCTLHLPSLRGVQIHTGHPSIPCHYLIISLGSWGIYPSIVIFFSSYISHFWHTWSLYTFLSTTLLYLWSILCNFRFFSLQLHGISSFSSILVF